jgi:chemotaxis protein MotB
MARKRHHEEHENHEAWAIPYGDLVTLLLAFFVVMYAISNVNEGKYRVLSDSLVAAFQGSPKTLEPVQAGEKQVGSGADIAMSVVQQGMLEGQPRSLLVVDQDANTEARQFGATGDRVEAAPEHLPSVETTRQMQKVADQVENAMADLVNKDLVVVRRHDFWVEVEIRTDILFPSGSATLSPAAIKALEQLAATLVTFPNPMRVEGHTDNRPISTAAFPSNWELSAARAASVVHLFTKQGVDPNRLAVIGLGDNRPTGGNDTPEGRNANRRVVLVILSGDGNPEGAYATERGRSEINASPALSSLTATDPVRLPDGNALPAN